MINSTVSVIIPTYNRADLLPRAINSVLANVSESDEILVVDDGSEDRTAEVVRKYGTRVRYIPLEHRGAGVARNVGGANATGDFIAFLDSDDEWMPGKLSLQLKLMGARPDLLFSFTNFGVRTPRYEQPHYMLTWIRQEVTLEGLFGKPRRFSQFCPVEPGETDVDVYVADMYPLLMTMSCIQTGTLLVRRRPDILDVLKFAEDLPTFEDWECFARLARCGLSAYIDCDTVWQYGHAGPRLTDADELTRADTRLQLLERLWGSDESFLASNEHAYKEAVHVQQLRKARSLLALGKPAEARSEMRKVGKGVPVSYRLASLLPGWTLRLRSRLLGSY